MSLQGDESMTTRTSGFDAIGWLAATPFSRLSFVWPVLVAFALTLAPIPAYPAESYDSCAGFIDSIPAVITKPGTWCLRKNLSTSMTQSTAIRVEANNITIDCNGFKLGGLAGADAYSSGIGGESRLNITVRRCHIRGFNTGIHLVPADDDVGGNHTVEDNHLDGSACVGIYLRGDGSVIRRNRVLNTGRPSAYCPGQVHGILTGFDVDVIDNTVSGVLPTADGYGAGDAFGINTSYNDGGSIRGNRVRGLVSIGSGAAIGIVSTNTGRISLHDNDLAGPGTWGLFCDSTQALAKGNVISGFAHAILSCVDAGNAIVP